MIGTLIENVLYWDAVAKTEKSRRNINARTKKETEEECRWQIKEDCRCKEEKEIHAVEFFPNRLANVDGYEHEKVNAKKQGICVVCSIESKKQRDALLNKAGSGSNDE